MTKLAFLGMGVMGYPMAGHLADKGFDVKVYNRNFAKAKTWVKEHGGASSKTPREAADGADIVFACVGNDDDLRSVVLGVDGALAGMAKGSIFVDHTTTSATVAIELAGLTEAADIGFIDAPVSGGQAGAEKGQLTVMCGGSQANYDRVKDYINSFAKSCRLMGAQGAGQLTKMVNQICIAGLVQGLSEGMHFAQKAGLDGEAVLDVISKGAAGSWQMENRGSTMLKDEFEFGFAVDWMRKDLGIVLNEANNIGASVPVTALVDQFYGDLQKMGGGRWDTSSLMRRLK
jgi:3-hydroxyisobutyrate dehydrogenase-like beta-hydroxyacid dehydrogenase